MADVNNKIASMHGDNWLVYMSNTNVSKPCLSTDGLHLVERRKSILANNFINILNGFLEMHHHLQTIHKR